MAESYAPTSGTVGEKPLTHLLVYVAGRRLTGSLELEKEDGSESATVVFSGGDVARIRTSPAVPALGTMLYEMGFIDANEVNASLLDVAKYKKPHGQILLGRGTITREQLGDGLREQTVQKLVHLHTFNAATYTFHPDVDKLPGYGGDDVVLIDPAPAIWRGVRDHGATTEIEAIIARTGGAPCRLVRDAKVDRFRFRSEELAVVECLRIKPHSVDELAATAIVSPDVARRLFYCLVVMKSLEVLAHGDARASTTPVPPRRISSLPPRPSASMQLNPRVLRELAERADAIRARARAIAEEDFFQRLSLTREATTEDVEAAFKAVTVAWDPARLPPALEAAREEHSFVHAALVEAREVLADPRKRAEYANRLSLGILPPTAKEDLAASGKDDEYDGAKACLERSDMARAERLARRALKAKPGDARAMALFAWIDASRESSSPEAVARSGQLLDRALRIDPECRDALFFRASLNMRADRHAGAIRDLEKLLALYPDDADALRELRVCETHVNDAAATTDDGAPHSTKGISGLFDRFRRK